MTALNSWKINGLPVSIIRNHTKIVITSGYYAPSHVGHLECARLGIRIVDGLGDKIRASSDILKGLEA